MIQWLIRFFQREEIAELTDAGFCVASDVRPGYYYVQSDDKYLKVLQISSFSILDKPALMFVLKEKGDKHQYFFTFTDSILSVKCEVARTIPRWGSPTI